MPRLLPIIAVLSLPLAGITLSQEPAGVREWTRTGSAKFKAVLRGIDGPNVVLQAADGRSAAFPLATFSAEDRGWVAAHVAGLVVDAMTPPGVGRKDGAGWGAPLSAAAADCAVETFAASAQTKNRAGFRSRHFTFFCGTALPAETMRDIAEGCEAVHELFRVAPWGVLATPEDGERHVVELFPTSEAYRAAGGHDNTSGDYDDERHTLRITFGAAGLEQIGGVWTRPEHPTAATMMKHQTSILLMHDVLTLVPPWVVDGIAEVISHVPVVGATAWPADLPPGLRKTAAKGAPDKDAIVAMLTAPAEDAKPARPSTAHSALLAYYFMRLADGNRAQPLSKALKDAKADRVKWDDFERARVKYKLDWDAFVKLPGVKSLPDGRVEFPGNLTPPEPPKLPREVSPGASITWLLLPTLLDGKTPASLADDVVAKLQKEGL